MSDQPIRVNFSNEHQVVDMEEGHADEHPKKPSDPITQWRCLTWGIIATQRLKGSSPEAALEAIFSDHSPIPLPAIFNPPPFNEFIEECPEENNVHSKRQGRDAESNSFNEKKLQYLMVVHNALVQQLSAHGIVLTLLAAVTSVAILQPPGSFDQGHMQPYSLVACFLFFSSLSFLLACTGLMAVIIGSASLFRPWFYPTIHGIVDPTFPSLEENKDSVVYDDIKTLGKIVLDNLLRVRRLRMYLALSLGLCMVAFVCGAFSILGSEKRNLYIAVGTVIGSGGVLAVETGMTLAGPTLPPKWVKIVQRILTKMGSARSRQEAAKKNTSNRLRAATGI